jgi:GAF domain-containing protein/HAMP domain-containing protein
MRKTFDSLVFKIAVAVIAVEVIVLAAIGIYYVTRFTRQWEARVRNRIPIPGELLERQQTALSMVADQEILEELIGEVVRESVFVDTDLQVSYAMDPAYEQQHVSQVPGVVVGEFDPDMAEGKLREVSDGWIYITPVRPQPLGETTGFWYVRVGTERLVSLRRETTGLFVIGSAICVAVTSVAITYILNSLVLRRISALSSVVRQVQAGDLSVTMPGFFAADEIGVLQRGVDTMVTQLREMFTSLEQRVETRTQDLRRRARYLETTADVAQDVASELDLQELLDRIVHLISERFGFYHAGIFLLDETGEWAVLQAASSEGGRRMLDRGHRLGVGRTGTVGYVTAEGEPRIALDVGEDAEFFDNPDLPQTRSAMTLPLRARGEIIGALDVQSTQPAAFTDEDAAVLQMLADQLATAIDNARLIQEAQEAAEVAQRAYGEITRSAWRRALALQAQGLGYYCDREGVSAVDNVQRFIEPADEPAEDAAPGVMIPLTIRDQVVGVVRANKSSDEAWTEDERELLQTLLEQLSVALEDARVYQESQLNAMQQRLVSEITAEFRRSLEINTVLETAAREMRDVLGLEEAEVRLNVAGVAQTDELDAQSIEDLG